MSEATIKLTGWKAVVALVVIVVGAALLMLGSIQDRQDDEALVSKVRQALRTEYFPGDVDRMQQAYEAGDSQALTDAARTTVTTRIRIESLKASIPLFDFSSDVKDAVVKVVYVIENADGVRESGTRYYRFEYRPLVNTWHYRYESWAPGYYLNFF